MINSASILLITSLVLSACASNFNNGVSTWNTTKTRSQPELLETQEFESYVVEEINSPEYQVVETEINQLAEQDLVAVSSTTPTMVLAKPQETVLVNNYVAYDYPSPAPVSVMDQINLTSSSSRSWNNSNVPESVVVLPEEVEVEVSRPVVVSNNTHSGTYSNKSRGPYHHTYGSPVRTHTQSYTTTSSATRSYNANQYNSGRNLNTGCFANLDYPSNLDDQVSKRTSVLCQSQLSSGLVSKIQASLNGAGFNAGPVTGYLSTKTLDALYRYQTSRYLPAGAVTLNTLNSLGINSYNF